VSYVRVSILGSTAGGEVWSINPVFDPTAEFPGGVDQAMLDAAAAAIAALSPGATLLGMLSTGMSITGARVEVRDDATDALIGISIATRTTALAGTGAATMPPQCAWVVSLRTNTPGGSGRGRVYWPLMDATLNSSGRIPTAEVTAGLSAMRLYLTAIRDALATAFPTIGYNLAVRSRTQLATPHVVRIQAGDVVDTQRRRRDALPEAYQTLTFP
jgi:hypothetical protein